MYFINSLMQGVELATAQPRGKTICQGPAFLKEEERKRTIIIFLPPPPPPASP